MLLCDVAGIRRLAFSTSESMRTKNQSRSVRAGEEQHGRKSRALVLYLADHLLRCVLAKRCREHRRPDSTISAYFRRPGPYLVVIEFGFPCHQSALRIQRSLRACIVQILRRNSLCLVVDNTQIRTHSHNCVREHGHRCVDLCSSIRQTDSINQQHNLFNHDPIHEPNI